MSLKDEWTDKNAVCPQTAGYYSALNRKEILAQATTLLGWMDLEDIVLSERSQSQKDKSCISLYIYVRDLEYLKL